MGLHIEKCIQYSLYKDLISISLTYFEWSKFHKKVIFKNTKNLNRQDIKITPKYMKILSTPLKEIKICYVGIMII